MDVTRYAPIFEKLEGLRETGQGRWKANCPAHQDGNASLMLKVTTDDYRMLINCHAGCTFDDVRKSLGLPSAAFFAAEREHNVQNVKKKKRVVAEYWYRDEARAPLYQSCRTEPKDFWQRRPAARGGWEYNLDGVRRVLYRLPELLEADPRRWVLIPEGEKDVDLLWEMGFVATTNVGGAGKWCSRNMETNYGESLQNRSVVILPDNDKAGWLHATEVEWDLRKKTSRVIVVRLPGLPHKGDVSDWIQGQRMGAEDLKREIVKAASSA